MMDNIREKLVELLCEATTYTNNKWRKMIVSVDYLISHGVTVQEWIPVTERLPTKEDGNLVDGYLIAVKVGEKPTLWKWHEVANCPKYFSCWYALPQPPKGE